MSGNRTNSTGSQWWWIAINGASCAAAPAPSSSAPSAVPTPQQLIGYRTQHEQLTAQRLILREPMEEVERYLGGLPSRIQSGEIQYIRLDNPEPPTHGQTQWIFPIEEDVQRRPSEQISKSTTTPTLRCLIPKEGIEPLKKLGRTDWLRIVTHSEGHRFEFDESVLDTLADHPDFLRVLVAASSSDRGSLIQFLAYSKLLAGGPSCPREKAVHIRKMLNSRDSETDVQEILGSALGAGTIDDQVIADPPYHICNANKDR